MSSVKRIIFSKYVFSNFLIYVLRFFEESRGYTLFSLAKRLILKICYAFYIIGNFPRYSKGLDREIHSHISYDIN